jgi:hypothetical protein
MTPKKKAKEIFTRMYNSYDALNKYPMCFDTAKQCALIAVNEIIENEKIDNLEDNNLSYWQKVKTEIEKL